MLSILLWIYKKYDRSVRFQQHKEMIAQHDVKQAIHTLNYYLQNTGNCNRFM